VFDRVPVPYFEEEFSIDTIFTTSVADKKEDIAVKKEDLSEEREYMFNKKDTMYEKAEPTPFIRIKRSILYQITIGSNFGCF
jgi:uncharacterized ferredoxin-like protein